MEGPKIQGCGTCKGERLVYRLRDGQMVPVSTVEEWSFAERIRRLARISGPVRCPGCSLGAPKTREKSVSS